jgi:hypothetical protein
MYKNKRKLNSSLEKIVLYFFTTFLLQSLKKNEKNYKEMKNKCPHGHSSKHLLLGFMKENKKIYKKMKNNSKRIQNPLSSDVGVQVPPLVPL